MKEELYQQALADFIEANSLAPRESVQNNIARSYRQLKDLASAYREYEVLLAKYGDKMSAAKKADTTRVLEELATLTGVAVVTVSEPDAAITVDGAAAGRTPLSKPIRVNLGQHQIVVQKAGFEPFSQQFETRGHDSVTVAGPLQKEILTGHVSVKVEPPDPTTQVLVDGAPVGPAPWAGDLPAGTHTISAKSDTMASVAEALAVAKKGSYDVDLKQVAQLGTLAVTVNVPAADISLDGKVVGRGAFEAQFPAGTHQLSVEAPGYKAFVLGVNLTVQQRTMQAVTLEPVPIAERVHDWTGVYTQLNFLGVLQPGKPTNDIAQGRGYTTDTKISGSSAAGGGFNFRVGYSFGYIGIEGSLLGSFDYSSATATLAETQHSIQHPAPFGTPDNPLNPPIGSYSESYSFIRIGGEATVGVRFMPKMQGIRPTIGVGGGLAMKGVIYARSASGSGNGGSGPLSSLSSTYSSSFSPYFAPALNIDAGIELGRTPGTRFYLGAILMAEFASPTAAQGVNNTQTDQNSGNGPFPAANINVVNSTEIYIGPVLGMQFGE